MKRAPKHKQHRRSKRRAFGLLVAPLVIVLLAAVISFDVSDRFNQEQIAKFETQAQDTFSLATVNLNNYSDLLYSGRAYVLSNKVINAQQWRSFYNQQSIFSRYPGVSSVSYVERIATQDLVAYEKRMMSIEYFGPSYKLKDVSDRPTHGFVSAYVSQNDISSVIGLDLFKKNDRYEVYTAAEAKNTTVASPVTMLATGHKGFFVVLPVFIGDSLNGYVLSSYRLDDLMEGLWTNSQFEYKVTDVTDRRPVVLYESSGDVSGAYKVEHLVEVGGRRWNVSLFRQPENRPLGYLLPAAIIFTGIIMAMTVYSYSNVELRERILRIKRRRDSNKTTSL